MTKKLYLDDPYLQNCSAEIIEHTEIQGKPGVILNQTVFYPTSGGQPHDTGTINDVAVIDVLEDENRQIAHVLEKPLKTSQVECEINWQRRFDHMQQHTGQHILSQAFLKTHDADTISFHLGERSSTIDIDQAGLTPETLIRVEQLANGVIFENRLISAHTISRSEIHRFPIRKPPTVEDRIRILEIKDFDYSACGGTHCSKTGEIGMLKISRHENYKGGTRIHFLCGFRALIDYRDKTKILKQLSKAMSTAEADLPQSITRLRDDLKALTAARDHLNKKLLDYEASWLFSEGTKQADIRLIKKIFTGRHQKEINLLAKKIAEKSPDTVILLGIKSEGKAHLLFQCSKELPFDMGKLMQTACAIINGRGGGRPQQAQGGGPAVEKLEGALKGAEDMLFQMIDSV
ncbi:MAG: DHHA1 domain-containing protein [Desulfobacterales bacterium]|jgi:alanyl-tRNA synthetase